jgi:hypothetical protein
MRELIDYIKGMLDGKQPQSFSRGSCAFIIYFKVCESLYIVSGTSTIPDIPVQWMALISLLYLGGKGIDAITAVKSGGENGVVTQ